MNLISIIIATIVSMGIGAFWFSSRLFGTAWARELKLDHKKISKESAKSAYLFTGIGTFVMTIVLGQVIRMFTTTPTVVDGALVGLMLGIGLLTPAIAINHIFEGKSPKLFLIVAGHHAATLFASGIVIGLLS